jgi:hypothetical protein
MPEERPSKKKIVYLLGAGASQGELSLGEAPRPILMQDIVDGLSIKISKDEIDSLSPVSNELGIEGIDVEHLITLYEASGTREHNEIARELKKNFRKEIQDRINELGDTFSPQLYSVLLDMHLIDGLDEELVAILTINYEDLLERAMQSVHNSINYSIKVSNRHTSFIIDEKSPPILKLHGSFNWKTENPIAIVDSLADEEDVLWIPPGVAKKRDIYPFSVIWGRARELLECDILRIIGCSLSRNDWELVSLLYTTQKLRTDRKSYRIEIISSPRTCEEIKKNYKYLTIDGILDIPYTRDHLISEYFPHHVGKPIVGDVLEELMENVTSDKYNMFAIWLRAKGERLQQDGIPIRSDRLNVFENFIKSGLGLSNEEKE